VPYRDPERRRQAQRAYRAANPEKIAALEESRREKKREYMRRYNAENRDLIAARRALRGEAIRAQQRIYRTENAEKVRDIKRRWRENNRERVRECDRLWKAENLEKVKEQRRRHYWLHRDAYLEKEALRRAAGYQREWRSKNLEKARECERASRTRNRNGRLAYAKRYHAQRYHEFADRKRAREIARKLAQGLGVKIEHVPPHLLEAKLLQVRVLREVKVKWNSRA